MKEFYAQFISKSDVVFDIGANVGNRLPVFSELARRVVAVEPQPGLIQGKWHNVTVLEKACGATDGTGNIRISNSPSVTSMSGEWIEAIQKTGRLPGCTWGEEREVEVVTLDSLIREYGTPSFVKIDVEGYEYEVLKGLSKAIHALSFEFTPEHMDAAFYSVVRLLMIGKYEFQWDFRETFSMPRGEWMDDVGLMRDLRRFEGDNIAYLDIYARVR